ncbi:heavy metal-associated isoprenylated plant protein 36-like [Trifolium pratense]|nr:heavy metal-associated isoprenylated plant protein 36-like [Trifolium pratense]
MAAAKPPSDQQVPPGSEETLKYQTWVLKVLIHCDGCTKRVKKILQGIEGVYKTEIDSQAHKVTVTGNVAAETLIKKLSRSGKSVELWPEKPPEKKDNKKDKKSSKSKDETENSTNKEKEGQKNTEQVGEISHDHQGCIDDDGGDDGEEDSDQDHKEGNNNNNGDSNKSEGGAKKKKKKKKKNKSGSVTPNNGGGEKVIIGTETIDAPVAIPKEMIMPPPPQVLQQHGTYNPYQPHMYYSHPPLTPAPPPYGLSYNTSYPVSTTSSYYVGAPVMPMHANYARLPPPPPPSHPTNNYGYHNDHEEYEGGYCSIM